MHQANGLKHGTAMHPLSKKELILPGILLAGFIAFFASGAHEFFSWQVLGQHYNAIKGFAGDKKWLSYLGFFCAYSAVVAFSLPIATLLTLAGGAILGWPAATLAVVAATAGAGLVFFAARNLFSDILQRRAGPFLGKLEDGFSQNAFFYLLALRLVPTAPFWVVNILPALTRMGIAQFLAATFIGIIPGSFVYVWVGRSFDQALAAGQTPDFSILSSSNILLPLAALGLLSLMPVLVRIRQTRIKNSRKDK
tara:strand:+ start:361 stop:1116 length:756 start_codon:yes stop_codon:yes gene_type:complete